MNAQLSAIRACWRQPIDARFTSGYEGQNSSSPTAHESGANVRYVGTACAKSDWSAHDCEWLEAKGVSVKFRASLEEICTPWTP
ncbi:MAG: hypothetical protein CM15mP74_31110 [Halieaceae bacterium]|nr:MAG: hypothetical protein CM15mP74_31110 [Halieaceae bacterium]